MDFIDGGAEVGAVEGGCGFFEAIDDQALADKLFDAARLWLSSRGMEAMDGPINFGPRDSWWGLLVKGYEFQPLYENPYNPPYYRELFEKYYPGQSRMVADFWMPNRDWEGCDVDDPSARVLANYGGSGV